MKRNNVSRQARVRKFYTKYVLCYEGWKAFGNIYETAFIAWSSPFHLIQGYISWR
jgi:hypothetical protein